MLRTGRGDCAWTPEHPEIEMFSGVFSLVTAGAGAEVSEQEINALQNSNRC